MSGSCEDPAKRSGKAGVRTNPANYQPLTSTSVHGRNTFGQNIPHHSDNSSDFDVWVAPNISDVQPDQGAIPNVKPAGGGFQKAWTDFHVSIKKKADMKILEQCDCKESGILPVKMQYLLNFHFKELETALYDELFKLKWHVECAKPGDQCLSIEVKNHTDESVLEYVILVLSDEVNKVNYCRSMQASKHPELLLKEYIDSGNLAIYVDDEKVFVVGIVENQRKVIEMLRKKPTSTDYGSTAVYKMDVQLDTPFKCQLLIYLQFLPTLKQKHPSVKVTLDEERSIMSICGDNHVDVHATVEDVHLFTKDFAVEDIELDPLLIQLLKLQDIKTFIKQLCEEQDLKVMWTLSELNSRITCHCKDRKTVQDLRDVLHHNLEKKTYQYSKRSFGDKAIIFSTTNMFSDFVKKYDGKCLVSTVERNSIHIFTTRVISNDLALLEVNFERTKTDIQNNLTQDEKKEIHDQRTEVGTSVVQVPMPHQELQMLKKFNFKTYESTQIPDVQVTITDDGIDGTKRRLNVEATQGKSMIDRTKKTQKTTPAGDFKRIAAFDLSPLEYTMLKFYCGDCRLFVGKHEYTGGKLLRTLVSGEGEDDLKFVLKEKMDHIRTLLSIELQYSPGIEDEKLHEIKRSLSSSGEILCYRVDSKNLTFYGFSYEKLGVAKLKSEVLLGLKQQSKGRRNRVITTDQTFEKDDDKTIGAPKYQSFHDGRQSMSYKGSSATFLEQIYKTTKGIIVKVYNGNILSLKVDCIVNAANSQLSHRDGVAEVISRAAGYRFQQESDDYIQRYGSLDVGTCCATSAGDLIYKNVIHTVGPNWHKYTDKNVCCSDLKMAIECCFYEAEVCNVSSIAIPSISAGIFGVPVSVCTQQYALAVEEYSRKNGHATCLREIHFIDRDLGLVSAIQNEFNLRFNMVSSGPANTVPSDQPTGKSVKRESGYMRSKSEDHASIHQDKPPDITPVKFPKQYKTAKGIKLFIVEDNITKLSVDAIVCPQDEDLRSLGTIAKMIEKTCDEEYKRVVCKMPRISMTEVKKCKATPKGLPFRYVVHAVAPRWYKSAVHDEQKFMKDLELTIRNIIRHASDSKEIKTVALPVLGIGTIQETPSDIFVMLTAKIVNQESQKENFKLSEIYIVTNDNKVAIRLAGLFDKEQAFCPLTSFSRTRRNLTAEKKGNGFFNQQKFGEENLRKSTKADKLGTTVKHGDLDDCVICMEPPTLPRKLHCGHVFCDACIVQQFKVKPVCPTCGSIQGVVTGDQPPGTMKMRTSVLSLPGHDHCGRIEIEYVIHSGNQTAKHPNEGQWYKGITRIAYLPDNEKGKKIAKLLRVAFDRKLIFTIGHSRTTGEQGVVTWNDIHHKTTPNPGKQLGYPDDTYFDRVLYELKIKGVTEKDL